MPKILAIDDDRTVLRLIEKAFEGADVELTTVTNAEEGMTLLLKGGIDVCLLDIMLPEPPLLSCFSGHQICNFLK